MGGRSSLLTNQIQKTSFRAYTPYGYIWRTFAPERIWLYGISGQTNLPAGNFFFHYERKTLYGMKLHVNGQDWNNPWLLGLGNLTDQHLGISEAYSQEEPVGYEAFQHAVNEVIRKLDKKNKLAKKDKKNKPKEDKNNWQSGLQTYVGTILIMSIEPVRFIWLGNDFYLDLMKPMLPSRSLTTGERKLITSWKSVSACLDKEEYPDEITQMLFPITEEAVAQAEQDVRLARSCIGVRHLKDTTEEEKDQFGNYRWYQSHSKPYGMWGKPLNPGSGFP